MKKIDGIIYAMLSSVAFGLMPIFANATTVLILRFLLASVILFLYFIISGIDFRLTKKQLFQVIVIGAVGYSTTCVMLFLSYNYISVGLATTMHFVYPAIVTVLTLVVYKEKIRFNKIISLVLSMIGVYALVGLSQSHINFKGAFFAIFSGFTYACCVIAMGHEEIKKIDSRVLTFYLALSSGTILLIFGLVKHTIFINFNTHSVISIVGISLISTVIAIVAFVKGVKIIGPSSAAILSTFEPIVSIIMGIMMFNEKLTFAIIVGTVLIIMSVIILSVSTKKHKAEVNCDL